jgi:hypothetical protein
MHAQRLETGQPQEPAGALDGMDEPKDVAQKTFVIRVLLKLDQLDIEFRQTFRALHKKFAQ